MVSRFDRPQIRRHVFCIELRQRNTIPRSHAVAQAKDVMADLLNGLTGPTPSDQKQERQLRMFRDRMQHLAAADDRDRMEHGSKKQRGLTKGLLATSLLGNVTQGLAAAWWVPSV